MNKKQAIAKAKQKYGPGASAGNFSSKDRHQRFGIMFYRPGGVSAPVLGCLGHGDSYQAAWRHAEENPVAKSLAQDWKSTMEVDYKQFGQDPIGYKQRQVQKIMKEVEKLKSLGDQNG